MNVEQCINEGLLKETAPDTDKADASLEMAEHKLGLAKREFESEIYENAVVSAYASMFHSGRAILFRDGYKERSHYAIYVYLEERYSGQMERKYLNEFNSLRLERHELMYGLEKSGEVKEAEAESAISMAKGFLSLIRKLVEK